MQRESLESLRDQAIDRYGNGHVVNTATGTQQIEPQPERADPLLNQRR
jgi:hypothetical protein